MTASPTLRILTHSAPDSQALGERLGRLATVGTLMLLHGDLGAGKTTLTQGIARGLGIVAPIQSPTFTLVAEYDGHDGAGNPLRLYHLDLYRLTDASELDSFGFDDYLTPSDGVTVVEWPERAGSRLPPAYLLVQLAQAGAGQREITVEAIPPDGPYAPRLAALGQPDAVCPS